MKKRITQISTVFILILASLIIFNYSKIKRLIHTISLFDENVIAQNFQNMADHYPVMSLKKSNRPLILPERKYYQPKGQFSFEGNQYDIKQYLTDTRTEGLIILHHDTIIYEEYYEDLEKNEQHISWSMAKSFTSALIGIYYEKQLFQLDDPVTKYLPDFKGTGYDGVSIRNLLNMSSGVGFNEDYGDFYSDINRFGRAFAVGSPIREFAKSLENARPQGTFNHYVSIDTQVLAFLLMEITGKSITELTQIHLWDPLGMEYDGSWIVDEDNIEIALGGLNASLRDYTKLGICYKNNGFLNGNQIIPSEWIKSSLLMDQDHLVPGKHNLSSNIHGYGFQWWIPVNNQNAYAMGGIYNQYVYIDPVNDIVIAKLSANHHYKKQGHITKTMHFVMFEEIIKDIIKSESRL